MSDFVTLYRHDAATKISTEQKDAFQIKKINQTAKSVLKTGCFSFNISYLFFALGLPRAIQIGNEY